ncbi:MAG: 4-hydroxyphenylpyruvate dioxygenase [Thermoleophilia bacterium]|nr:4-hydroxyphenylpyruvate dioxygenase [Thermoleophilia bacterium]
MTDATNPSDPFPVEGMHHLEFWVANAKQAAFFYERAYGFVPVAYQGLTTGVRDRSSYVMQQGNVRFVLTSPLQAGHEIGAHIETHGDGVRDLAISVPDARAAYEHAISKGAVGFREPETIHDESGAVTIAAIRTYGDTIHSLVERGSYAGAFLPGFEALPIAPDTDFAGVGIKDIDHCVGNTADMNPWVKFYGDVMGFTELNQFTDEDINTEYSALMSKVVSSGDGKVKFPINEPAEAARKSQIEEYLDYYGGPGVQHIALETDDIIATVQALKDRGVPFLGRPGTYYEEAVKRIGPIDENWEDLQRLGILVDKDEEGYLLQIFTGNVQDRPTVFFEIIQRKGAKGFGDGNFKALFEAIEAEQALRGNL